MGEDLTHRSRKTRRKEGLGKVYHLPVSQYHQQHILNPIDVLRRPKPAEVKLTVGTVSLSACALAASVVTVLLTSAALGKAVLRRAAGRLVLNALENMVVVGQWVVEKIRGRWRRKRVREEMWLIGAHNKFRRVLAPSIFSLAEHRPKLLRLT